MTTSETITQDLQTYRELRDRLPVLLRAGREAGISISEMARLLAVTRQTVYNLLGR